MKKNEPFQRRGIVEGFFGPLWSMRHRQRLFEFGAARGMNTYLYAPKDDPYHRARWTRSYPPKQWEALAQLIRHARKCRIEFVYGFHPGKGLCFSDEKAIRALLRKARRFYDRGVRTFAVLFDDIPSRLEHRVDRRRFKQSLARAEGAWLEQIQCHQPVSWQDVEWWICPSYYTSDPLLARTFGEFEPHFLETLAESLPSNVACFWTGPAVVPERIRLADIRPVARRVKHRLILWDNYPVNDLSMSDELHIGPLQGRESRLSELAYGYLNNPLLQEELSLIPLATCFDYAGDPATYHAEASWKRIVEELFGPDALPYWQAIRKFCDASRRAKKIKRPIRLSAADRVRLRDAVYYIKAHRTLGWVRELRPWMESMAEACR